MHTAYAVRRADEGCGHRGGSWGTTVAALAAVNTPTMLWARRDELADEINQRHVNSDYLAQFTLPDELRATASLAEAVADADVLVMAVPSHGFRDVVAAAAEHVRAWVPVVSLTKGLERNSLKRMSEVIRDEMPGHPVAVLTGPNLAKEILSGQPAASVVAIDEFDIATELQRIFSRPSLAGLHQQRCRRLRAQRRGQERHRHRGRYGRGHGLRRQHAGDADHARPGGDDAPRNCDGRSGGDVRRTGRHGRPDCDVFVEAEPQQHGRLPTRRGQDHRRRARRDEHGGRRA